MGKLRVKQDFLRVCSFGKSAGDDFSLISNCVPYIVISVSLQLLVSGTLPTAITEYASQIFRSLMVAMLRRNIDLGVLKLDVMLLTLLKLFNQLKAR